MAGIAISSKLIFPEIKNELVKQFDYISVENNPHLPPHEQTHVDLQICKLSDNELIISPTISQTIKAIFIEKHINFSYAEEKDSLSTYPDCAYIDALVAGNFLFHNQKISSKTLLEKANKIHFITVDVHQGYTGCNAFYFQKLDLIVTSDKSILDKAKDNSFNIFELDQSITQNINIEGYDHGFIGGCLGYSKETDTLFVNGNISYTIPELYQLVKQTGTKIVECEENLTDIGGILFI